MKGKGVYVWKKTDNLIEVAKKLEAGTIIFDPTTLRVEEVTENGIKQPKTLAIDYISGNVLNGPFEPENTYFLDSLGVGRFPGKFSYKDLIERGINPMLIAYTNIAGRITEAEEIVREGGIEFGHDRDTFKRIKISPKEAHLKIQMTKYMPEDEDA